MARRNYRDDIDITKEELNQISEALKKEEFRKLFIDYVDEINDPENKAIFEKEITQYEKERGIDVTFIHPKPGYVIKTSVDGAKKAFINVCANDKIGKPSAAKGFQEGTTGTEWSLPYIQAPPRDDLDKDRKLCLVCDVIFHPLTLELAKKDRRLKSFVNDTALAAVENSFGVSLDKNNLKFPNMGFKGYKHPCVIRKKISKVEAGPSEDPLEGVIPNAYYPYSEPVSEPAVFTPKHEIRTDEYTTPKYHIKHRKNLDFQEFTNSNDAKMNTCVAHEVLIEINLPLIRSTSDIDLLLSEKTLSLKSESPAKYKLEINLPYSIIENESSAKFDSSSRKLLVTAIVDRQKHCLAKEDSGLESDPSRGMSSSSDEDLSKLDQETPVIINSTDNVPQESPNPKSHSSENENYLVMDSPEDMDMDIVESFLNPDMYYSLPPSTLHKISTSIIANLSVKNAEPSSVTHIFSENNSLFQIKFYSMGSGFVPINYAACLKLESSCFIPMSLKTDVYDNSVNFSVSFCGDNGYELSSVHFGRELSSLQEVAISEFNPTSDTPTKAVTDFINRDKRKRSGDVILKLSKLRLYSTADDDSDDCEEEETFEDAPVNNNVSISNSSTTQNMNNNKPCPIKIEKKIRRTYSESGCAIPLIQRRSILKDTRSLSESSANDYAGFSVSMDSEDGPNENGHVKKHVRFSETISKKVFRANSSILGQRKKNQRKARNKKRSVERRTSESSGVSESEVSELEVSEVSDLSEVSDISETSESDDGSAVERQVLQTPGSKGHRRKGKKNHRKSANTAKMNCLFYNDA